MPSIVNRLFTIVNGLFTFMRIYTPEEILFRVKSITNDNYDSDFAARIGVQKQSLSQYKNKNSVDVQLRIISLLLDIIDEKASNK